MQWRIYSKFSKNFYSSKDMMHSSLHLFPCKLTKTSNIILTASVLRVKSLHFFTENKKKIIKVIKGTVTSYFFKNARIIAASYHICQSSDNSWNRRKSEFGPNSEPNCWTMGSVWSNMCSGTLLRTLSVHAKLTFPYYQISFLWEISDNFQVLL